MRKEAHRWLQHVREQCARARQEVADLTHGLPDFVPPLPRAPALDWKRYVASHPQGWEIVGPGVVKFEARFVNSPEPNARQLALPAPYGQFRFDFCVHRVDGTCVRLHPSQNRDAAPVVGTLASWLLEACASTPSYTPPPTSSDERPPNMFMELGPVDIVSSETAERMLVDRVRAAAAEAAITPEEVHEDLMNSVWFDWVRFLKARPFGQALLRQGVTSLTLHCSASTPAIAVVLVVTTAKDTDERVIWFRNGKAVLF